MSIKKDELYNKLIENTATLLSAIQDMYEITQTTSLIDEILIEQIKQNNRTKSAIEWGVVLLDASGGVSRSILEMWGKFDDSLVRRGRHHFHLSTMPEEQP